MKHHKDGTKQGQAISSTKRPQVIEKTTPETNNPENNSRKSWMLNHFIYVETMTETNYPYDKKLIRCNVKKNGTNTLGCYLKKILGGHLLCTRKKLLIRNKRPLCVSGL